jgi:hypothetical protein
MADQFFTILNKNEWYICYIASIFGELDIDIDLSKIKQEINLFESKQWNIYQVI